MTPHRIYDSALNSKKFDKKINKSGNIEFFKAEGI